MLGRWGDNATNSFGTNAYTLLDSGGDDTHVTLNWDATGNWSQVGGGTPTAQGSPDGNLINGYCDSGGGANVALVNNTSLYAQNGNNKPLVYLQGLQAWLATEGASYYDVVVYANGDSTGRLGEYWLVNASSGATTGPITNLTFGADLTTHDFICPRAIFTTSLTYAQVPLDNLTGFGAALGNTPGNFIVFPSLSADSFMLRTEEWRAPGGTLRSPINAIQIIPRTTASPPFIAPLQASSVYAGGTARFRGQVGGMVPIAYQWQKSGTPLTDGGNISGSSTTTLSITGVSGGMSPITRWWLPMPMGR